MSDKLAAALIANHSEAHALLERVANLIDGINPDTANWGDVGELGYIIEKLKDITGDSN